MNINQHYETGLMWFRRDLRVTDNAALHLALSSCQRVYCVFVFDDDILNPLPRRDRRVEFIRESLVELDETLRLLNKHHHGGLIVRHAMARYEMAQLAQQLQVQAVFAARDYEPAAISRDAVVESALKKCGIDFVTCKDHVIFEQREILTQAGTVYNVFTPYKNNWLSKLDSEHLYNHDISKLSHKLAIPPAKWRGAVPALTDIGFQASNLKELEIPTGMRGGQQLFGDFLTRMDNYQITRDFPAVKGPSYLGIHIRFGTVSLRQLVATARQRQLVGSAGATVWLSELIWRDFYFSILANFPHVTQCAFKPEYDAISWERGADAETLFVAWCEGRTGYPLVDAAMAQINQSGYMHNRLRMVTGSFLVKDLGLDWRWGESYFAQHLNDFELSANNGGWQWVSSSGCDAQPYFRIFNPINQSKKFDPEGKFIRRYLPQLAKLSNKSIHAPWTAKPFELQAAKVTLGGNYPHPIVAHEEARMRTSLRYSAIRKHASALRPGTSD
jgi:deoxyribodipyrimidine photo-lyase